MRENLPLLGRLAAVDVETTGFSRENDRIVEVGFAWSHGQTARHLVDPGRPIPSRVSEIHGIRDADVARAPPFVGVAGLVVDHWQRTQSGGYEIVTYNGRSLDLPMICAEMARAGVPTHIFRLDEVIDVLPWAKKLKLDKGHSLSAVCAHFGIRPGGHRADLDAEATISVAERLIREGVMPDNYGLALVGPTRSKDARTTTGP